MRRLSSVLDARQLEQSASDLSSRIRRVSSLIALCSSNGGSNGDVRQDAASNSSETPPPPCQGTALEDAQKSRNIEEDSDIVDLEQLHQETAYRRHRPAGRGRAARELEGELSELGRKAADALAATHVDIEAARDEGRRKLSEIERLEAELARTKGAWEERMATEEEAARQRKKSGRRRHSAASLDSTKSRAGPGESAAAPTFPRHRLRLSLGGSGHLGSPPPSPSSSSTVHNLSRRLSALQDAKARNSAKLRARVAELDARLASLERDVGSKQDAARRYRSEADILRTAKEREAEQCAEQRDMLRKRLSTLVKRVQRKEARLAFSDAVFAERIDSAMQDNSPRLLLAVSGALCA